MADRVAVMYGGRIVETSGVRELFATPMHPYTQGLLRRCPAGRAGSGSRHRRRGADARHDAGRVRVHAAVPSVVPGCAGDAPPFRARRSVAHDARCVLGGRGRRAAASRGRAEGERRRAVARVRAPRQGVHAGRGLVLARPTVVRAVDDVSFDIEAARRSGWSASRASGKTTTGRCVLRLIEPTSGAVLFKGDDVLALLAGAAARRAARHADGLPGPVLVAQPAHARRRRPSTNRSSSTGSATARTRWRAWRSCCALVGLDPRDDARSTRTSSAAGSGSGSASRARWR